MDILRTIINIWPIKSIEIRKKNQSLQSLTQKETMKEKLYVETSMPHVRLRPNPAAT